MSFIQQDIRHLTQLARLAMDDDELQRSERELGAILGYVERLQKVDTSVISSTSTLETSVNWRADQIEVCDSEVRQGIVRNFPDRQGDALRVPAVFEQPKA